MDKFEIAIVALGHPVHAHVSSESRWVRVARARGRERQRASDSFPHSCSWEYLLCTPRVAPFAAPSLARPLRPSIDVGEFITPSPTRLCDGRSNTFPPSRFLTSRSLDLYNVTRWSGDRLHVKDIAHWEHAICEVGVGVAFSEYGQLVTIRQILDYSVRKNKMRPALINGVNTSR